MAFVILVQLVATFADANRGLRELIVLIVTDLCFLIQLSIFENFKSVIKNEEICTLTCLNGGSCQNLADGTVQCICPNLYNGLNCEICE